MMKASSARITPGVWSNSMTGRICVVGILLAGDALFAQSPPARLARGIDDFEHGRYTAAIQELKAVQPQLPKLADYVAFYLASSRMELKDYTGALQDLAAFHHLSTASPLTLKAALMEARALCESGSPAGAIALLRGRYEELPQPSGDFGLAQAYEASQDQAQAATYYQRVYYSYPLSDAAPKAAKAMEALREQMGASYPPPMPQQMLERGSRFLAAHEYRKARAEFTSLVQDLGGSERDVAGAVRAERLHRIPEPSRHANNPQHSDRATGHESPEWPNA